MRKLTIALFFLLAGPARAQVQSETNVHTTIAQEKFVAMAGALSAEHYSWRPSEGVRSVSEVLSHVAGTNYVAGVSEERLSTEMNMFGTPGTGRSYLLLTVAHLHEHLGQVVAYARFNDVVPPADAEYSHRTIHLFDGHVVTENFMSKAHALHV